MTAESDIPIQSTNDVVLKPEDAEFVSKIRAGSGSEAFWKVLQGPPTEHTEKALRGVVRKNSQQPE